MKLFDKIFKPGKGKEEKGLTTITRTEIIEGISVPGIIKNHYYYFTDIEVYKDGLINCWEMVDLLMFKEKLAQGRIVPSIPDGESISIFSLGTWRIEQGEWLHSNESLYNYVYSLIKKLNPALENIVNYKGNNSKRVGKISIAKHAMPNAKPFHYDDINSIFPEKINGERFHIFYRNNDNKTYLAILSLYKSGHIEITNLPQKKVHTIDEIDQLFESRQLTTILNTGETVTIYNLGSFTIKSGEGVDEKFKIAEINNMFNELNGAENSIKKCRRIFEAYNENPTEELKNDLKEAYEAIPEHQRTFVGTMDTKDHDVRKIIYIPSR